MKRISVLGSTGSIGTQTLDIIKHSPEKFKAAALSCGKRTDILERQIEIFSPEAVSVADEKEAVRIQKKYRGLEVFWGREGLKTLAALEGCHTVVNGLMGMIGLEPTVAAAEKGKDIAFANKETLVAGGEAVMKAVRENGARLLPVDSEHSALFQCLRKERREDVRRLVLTASGGPFRGYTRRQLEGVTLKEALSHPNWSMGKKITVDSATMMNKGLEVIEARWLFDMPFEKIDVVIHPESVLHSAVEYTDGSVIGQMGAADMRIPIAYALSYPERLDLSGLVKRLDFFSVGKMTFCQVDREVFKTVDMAYEAGRRGGSWPVALNGANEVLAEAFLEERISFTDIQDTLERVMNEHVPEYGLDIEGIIEEDMRIREKVRNMI